MKARIICLVILCAQIASAQELKKMFRTDSEDVEGKLKIIAEAETPENARSFAEKLKQDFSGYCVFDQNPAKLVEHQAWQI